MANIWEIIFGGSSSDNNSASSDPCANCDSRHQKSDGIFANSDDDCDSCPHSSNYQNRERHKRTGQPYY